MFTSRVERTISAAHRNGPEGGKCARNHGHDWKITVEFSYEDDQVDQYGWGPDFGLVKLVLDGYDHQDLNDKMKDQAASAENFAKVLYAELHKTTGFAPDFVQVYEGNGNSVTYFDSDALASEEGDEIEPASPS